MSFDFDAAVRAPFRMQPGLRRLADGAAQLSPNRAGSRHLAAKLAVLLGDSSLALQCRDGFDATPALAALASHASREHPLAWGWDGHTASAHHLGWSVRGGDVHQTSATVAEVGTCLHALEPEWRLAALLALAFAEDFAVLDATDTTVPWLAVAMPSHWSPQHKVGRSFAHVHAPVADNRQLLESAHALVQLVCGEQRWERFVWSLTPSPHLNAHPALADAPRWQPDEAAAQAHWRTERQTFLALPDRRQAVFTIHVDVQPLAQAIDTPEKAQRLHDALATMSPAVLRYRGLVAVREPLLHWLAQRAAA
jgi:hypothetical protein